ncbi:hypothetical protein SAMN05444365_108149 [Micromonospora pattaloongensis]|uniref:Uncharacterized protein n=1 Tax=Micromonospora pattaloongensis TaxID=405436 RepID=A0A1H3RLV3_9ACTN|nr:hypothetical protein [Micromonospora pattaloongensis]SDZ26667.1 hypothetical protein SAMN05444365_108149 [Micromonospora pattaloongensis]
MPEPQPGEKHPAGQSAPSGPLQPTADRVGATSAGATSGAGGGEEPPTPAMPPVELPKTAVELPGTAVEPARWSGSASVPPPLPKRRWLGSAEEVPVTPPELPVDEHTPPEERTPVDPWADVDPVTPAPEAYPPPVSLPPTRPYPVAPPGPPPHPVSPPVPMPVPHPTAAPPPPPFSAPPVSPAVPAPQPHAVPQPQAPHPVPPQSPQQPVRKPPKRGRKRRGELTAPPPGWQPPPGYVPVRRRRRWPRLMAMMTLLTAACCCGIPGYLGKPMWDQYPATAAVQARVADLALRDDATSQQTVRRLERETRTAHLLAEQTFAAVYGDAARKRVTVFGTTGFRFSPDSDLETEMARLTESYGLSGVTPVDTGVRGLHEQCGVGTDAGTSVVVCAWADHGSLGVALFTRRSVEDSAALLDELRRALVTRG